MDLNVYKINIKNKIHHPIFEIQKDLENLYIYRFMLMKNIYYNNKSGYQLINDNNKHYTIINNTMKILIKSIKNMKKFYLEVSDNVKYIRHNMYYRKKDKYYVYKYDTKSVKDSLYCGLNNFIFHIIEILKQNYFDNLIAILKLLDLYKKIMYNLNIINMTLDNKNFCYISDFDKKYLRSNKLLINIYIKYNKLQKVKIQDTLDNTIQAEKNNCIDFCIVLPKYILYQKIYIYNYEKKYWCNQINGLFYKLYFKNIKIKIKNNYKKYVKLGYEENKNIITIFNLYFKPNIHCILNMTKSLNIIMYRLFITNIYNIKCNHLQLNSLKIQKQLYTYITFVYVKRKKKKQKYMMQIMNL